MARLIDADDTMSKLRAYADRKHEAGHTELANGILKAVNYIHNEVKRVDAVEVVHGRWIELPSMAPEYKCSKCGQSYEWWEVSEAHYCPNCGAKMDLEER